MEQYATGCDADMGGTSTARLDLDESSAVAGDPKLGLTPTHPTAKFWGEMRLGVRSDLQDRVRGGYAGFRSKARLFLLNA